MKSDECKDCGSYNPETEMCEGPRPSHPHIELHLVDSCPCSMCLIKTMCSDACTDYRDAMNGALRKKHEVVRENESI